MTVLDRDDEKTSKKKEDLRDEIRKLEQPHITDIKSALLDTLASGLLGKGLSNRERLTTLRSFCEMARAQLWIHALTCVCQVPNDMRLTKETLEKMGTEIEGIVVPPMQYHDERDRAAGLVRSYFEVPDVGQQYQSSSQPERQPFLAERTQEDYAHRILNDDMMRKVAAFIAMLQVHGVIRFEEQEPAFDLSGILGKKPTPPAPVLPARPPAELVARTSAQPRPPNPQETKPKSDIVDALDKRPKMQGVRAIVRGLGGDPDAAAKQAKDEAKEGAA